MQNYEKLIMDTLCGNTPKDKYDNLIRIKEITELCGTVNMSSFNQMKDAINGSLEISEYILCDGKF